ncbi:hypothetical protein [Pseudoalteromonas sp. Ld20]|uniref:hypothetical protein n=1 Tax=Pseudoalteromonas sp. Ld20 TaxID=649165 RepID=UPI00386E27B5
MRLRKVVPMVSGVLLSSSVLASSILEVEQYIMPTEVYALASSMFQSESDETRVALLREFKDLNYKALFADKHPSVVQEAEQIFVSTLELAQARESDKTKDDAIATSTYCLAMLASNVNAFASLEELELRKFQLGACENAVRKAHIGEQRLDANKLTFALPSSAEVIGFSATNSAAIISDRATWTLKLLLLEPAYSLKSVKFYGEEVNAEVWEALKKIKPDITEMVFKHTNNDQPYLEIYGSSAAKGVLISLDDLLLGDYSSLGVKYALKQGE